MRDLCRGPVLVAVVVVRIAGAERLHLGLFPLGDDVIADLLQGLQRLSPHPHLRAEDRSF